MANPALPLKENPWSCLELLCSLISHMWSTDLLSVFLGPDHFSPPTQLPAWVSAAASLCFYPVLFSLHCFPVQSKSIKTFVRFLAPWFTCFTDFPSLSLKSRALVVAFKTLHLWFNLGAAWAPPMANLIAVSGDGIQDLVWFWKPLLWWFWCAICRHLPAPSLWIHHPQLSPSWLLFQPQQSLCSFSNKANLPAYEMFLKEPVLKKRKSSRSKMISCYQTDDF